MGKKSIEKVIEALAKEHGESPEQIRTAMQQAIDDAFYGPQDDLTRYRQKHIPCKGERPTPEELIEYLTQKLLKQH